MIDVVNTVIFIGFVLALALGAGATVTRYLRYHARGWRRPRLLTRDVQVIGGLAITAGSLLGVRVIRATGVDTSGLATNLVWVLLTGIPVLWASIVYAYYELAVIERGKDEPYIERERPE